MKSYRVYLLSCILPFILVLAYSASAQTSEFTFQGKLNDTGTPAAGTYQMEFKLFDAVSGGNQIGPDVSLPAVQVAQGIFTVELNFGDAAFDGAARFLEIAVKRNASDAFTVLAPRQKVTSTPYAIKSRSADAATTAETATTADTANNALLFSGLDPSRFVKYDINNNVGIGTTSNGSKLAVAGVVESTTGGIKFPDATTQTTAGLTSVTTNGTLTGNGTSASPLGITSPLMVRDLDNPARQPVEARATEAGGIFVTVPAGKRLIIESVSGVVVSTGTSASAFGLQIADTFRVHYIAPSFTRPSGGNTVAYYTHLVRIYLSPGEQLRINYSSSPVSASVILSGFFVDVP